MKTLADIITTSINAGSSDIHLSTKRPASCRVHGQLYTLDNEILTNEDLQRMFQPFFALPNVSEKMEQFGEADFAFSFDAKSRFRVNMFKQKGELACVMRLLPTTMPNPEDLGLP